MPPSRLVLEAPAKVNLSLEVVGRRADGYHDLVSLFQPLTLADRVTLETLDRPGITLSCPDSDLPEDESNLAFRAARVFFEATGLGPGLAIILEKEIPVAAGLGGGSSDAAAVLTGLNRLHDHPVPQGRLAELALGLGADVPFFLESRSAWARGVGQILTPTALPEFEYVLINPGFPVATGWVFSRLRKPLTPPSSVATMEPRTVRGAPDLTSLSNDLQGIVTTRWPLVGELIERLEISGAGFAAMSGSGPTVFGVYDKLETADRAAEQIEKTARQAAQPWRIIRARGLK